MPYGVRRLAYGLMWPERFGELLELRGRDGTGYTLRSFDELGCIFVHVPKAAGVSVTRSLFGNLGGAHRTLRQYQVAFPHSLYERYFKFAFVRNPWDRLVSAYEFLAQGGFDAGDRRWAVRNLSEFDEFGDFVRGWLNHENIYSRVHFVPQYIFLRGANGDEPGVDFVGRVESFDRDFRHVCEVLGVDAQRRHDNVSSRRKNYREYYDEETKRMVGRTYSKDIELFGYEF